MAEVARTRRSQWLQLPDDAFKRFRVFQVSAETATEQSQQITLSKRHAAKMEGKADLKIKGMASGLGNKDFFRLPPRHTCNQ